MSRYDESFDLIAHSARYKMLLNSHKGDIETVPDDVLINMMRDEVMELERALARGEDEQVIVEAGDITNFLVGLVHRATQRYRARKSVRSPKVDTP